MAFSEMSCAPSEMGERVRTTGYRYMRQPPNVINVPVPDEDAEDLSVTQSRAFLTPRASIAPDTLEGNGTVRSTGFPARDNLLHPPGKTYSRSTSRVSAASRMSNAKSRTASPSPRLFRRHSVAIAERRLSEHHVNNTTVVEVQPANELQISEPLEVRTPRHNNWTM